MSAETTVPSAATPTGGWARLEATGVPMLVARLVVGGTFLWMGSQKIGDPVAFLKLIREYELVPEGMPWLLNTLAVGLPWVEVWCGLLLVLGVGLRGVGLTLAGLLAVFSTAILLRALSIQADEGLAFCAIAFDCGCGGGEEFVCSKLPQNAGLLLLSLLAMRVRGARWCLRPRILR